MPTIRRRPKEQKPKLFSFRLDYFIHDRIRERSELRAAHDLVEVMSPSRSLSALFTDVIHPARDTSIKSCEGHTGSADEVHALYRRLIFTAWVGHKRGGQTTRDDLREAH